MFKISTEPSQQAAFTGDPRLWPSGAYRSLFGNVVLVTDGKAVFLSPYSVRSDETSLGEQYAPLRAGTRIVIEVS